MMFLAKKLSKLLLTFLAGCMFGIALFHFMSSLVILTRTTDRMLSKALSVGFPLDQALPEPAVLKLQARMDRAVITNVSMFHQDPNIQNEDPDIHNENPDIHNENPDIHNENPDIHNENPDIHIENTDIHNEGADIHNEGADKRITGSVQYGTSLQETTAAAGLENSADVTTPHDLVRVYEEASTQAAEEMNSKEMQSINFSASEREQFQQTQVDNFCERNNLSSRKDAMLGRHILVSSRSNTAFCFAPKVGCTNLKILFFITQGALPTNELFKSRDGVDQQKLEAAISKLSIALLSQRRKNFIIKNYYKFVMYRNPIERLFSAYRSKVQRFPLHGLGHEKPHYNWLRMKIFEYKHKMLYTKWRATRGNDSIWITFSDFIDYWLYGGGLTFDEHFQSIYDLCQPCQIRYNYYGNFRTFTDDAAVLIEHLKANISLLREGYYQEGESTSDLAPQYYRSLSNQQKKLVINRLALDLSFYYSIFPSERNSHKLIMDTDIDIPIFDY